MVVNLPMWAKRVCSLCLGGRVGNVLQNNSLIWKNFSLRVEKIIPT